MSEDKIEKLFNHYLVEQSKENVATNILYLRGKYKVNLDLPNYITDNIYKLIGNAQLEDFSIEGLEDIQNQLMDAIRKIPWWRKLFRKKR